MKLRTWLAGAAATAAIGTGAILALRFTAPEAGAACCYFAAQEKDINQPGQKTLITWDPDRRLETFTVQPKFEGNAVDFGMVIPTPAQPKLDEMPRDFFKDLAIYTILMPLPQPMWVDLHLYPFDEESDRGDVLAAKSGAPGGRVPPRSPDKGVVVLESGVVGSLDYKIITAADANGLFDWLKENKYVYSGDQTTLDFYIKKKWFFTVMKIDPKQMKKGAKGEYSGEVTPTRFTFASDKCVYPLKITQLSVKDKTDALFYVQAPQEMDLEGDLSWMHSYRVMWLTFMLGCAANADQQTELNQRNQWVQAKMKKDPRYETTKLEWARKLGEEDIAVLEDPLRNYAQMGGGTLAAGDRMVTQEEFLKTVWDDYEKSKENKNDEYAKTRLKELEQMYSPTKGAIVKVANPNGQFTGSQWMWYPAREAPAEDVKGLSRLKGHLQKGQWVTKFRKVLRKDEMTDDLVLVPVGVGKEQEYVRIMPTSPP
ncbi:MAG: hypothetical protein FD180_4855 [Planctomycetota bacterium]|nr:MAG: hypothetical protein FD180_4855 [Planctomycetota bacterium]